MKFRIITGMLLVMLLSVGSSNVASAHEGDGDYWYGWGHGWGWGWGWGHGWRANNYVYGPDGMYARCRDEHKGGCCNKDKEKGVDDMAGKKCEHSCWDGPRYHRAYYYEDCCRGGHLEFESHKCCEKKDKDDNDK